MALVRAPLVSAVILALGASIGCALDWAVREPDADAGADAGSSDGATDAADGGAPDAVVEAAADATDCAALEADVAAKRKRARECQLAQSGQCAATVKDECACDVVVTRPDAAATTDYADAIAALLAACAVDCSAGCPQLGPPASWACLSDPGGVSCKP